MKNLLPLTITICVAIQSGVKSELLFENVWDGRAEMQEATWVKQSLTKSDVSGKSDFIKTTNEWKGKRHDEVLLRKYQQAYVLKPSFSTAYNQATAVLAFTGTIEGYSATYLASGRGIDLGKREYCALVKYWPKNGTESLWHYQVRAMLFSLISGRSDHRVSSLTKLEKFYPNDPTITRMRIISNRVYRFVSGKLATRKESLDDIAKLDELAQKFPTSGYINAYYSLVSDYARKYKDKKYYQFSSEAAKKLVALYQADRVDQYLIPFLKKSIKECDEKSK